MCKSLLLSMLLFISVMHVSASDKYPGLPPDCWKESRNVHFADVFKYRTEKDIIITKITPLHLEKKTYSPNKSYYFSLDGWRPEATVYIYAEKDHLVKIHFNDIHGVIDYKWINEKLFFISVWWGRIAGTDLIFDVEKEEVIYSEDKRAMYLAFYQFQAGCRQHGGCKCIKKDQPED